MRTPGIELTEEELELLRAVVSHANTNPSNCHLEVLHSSQTNLKDPSDVVAKLANKNLLENVLKKLVMRGMMRHVAADTQSRTYAVTDQGFAEVAETLSKSE